MTTQQFMVKALQGNTRVTRCGSVFIDGDGTLYSYGYHYPLARIIEGKAFINDAGYSATTSKHIGWAFSACAEIVGPEACYHAPLLHRSQHLTPVDIRESAYLKREMLWTEMNAKKRKDTRVYAWLQTKLDRMKATIAAADSLIPVSKVEW